MFHEVRLIDAEGEMLGVLSLNDAIQRAREEGMDLVEVSPGAVPPVCKILDYGKYKYEVQKRKNKAKKKQKIISIKEIKVRPGIEKHDLDVKLKQMRKFLEGGDKVKVSLRFRGREFTHQEIGLQLLESMGAQVADISKIESKPKLEGRQMLMVLTSLK